MRRVEFKYRGFPNKELAQEEAYKYIETLLNEDEVLKVYEEANMFVIELK